MIIWDRISDRPLDFEDGHFFVLDSPTPNKGKLPMAQLPMVKRGYAEVKDTISQKCSRSRLDNGGPKRQRSGSVQRRAWVI